MTVQKKHFTCVCHLLVCLVVDMTSMKKKKYPKLLSSLCLSSLAHDNEEEQEEEVYKLLPAR